MCSLPQGEGAALAALSFQQAGTHAGTPKVIPGGAAAHLLLRA